MKTRLTFLICFLLLFCGACKEQNKAKNKTENKAEKIEQKFKPEEQITYGISFSMICPFELFVNDILAYKNFSGGGSNANVRINEYLLKSGTYKFKFILYPPYRNKDGLLHPDNIRYSPIKVVNFDKNFKFGEAQEFYFPEIKEPVPFLECEYEFNAELPYNLEGWSNSRVFAPKTSQDSAILMQQVVTAYENIRTMLNTGDIDAYHDLWKRYRSDRLIFEYKTQEELDAIAKETIQTLKKEAVSHMVPIEDVELKIYAQGRIVCLQRRATTEAYDCDVNLKDWSPLIRDYDDEISGMGGILHYNEEIQDFEIIR